MALKDHGRREGYEIWLWILLLSKRNVTQVTWEGYEINLGDNTPFGTWLTIFAQSIAVVGIEDPHSNNCLNSQSNLLPHISLVILIPLIDWIGSCMNFVSRLMIRTRESSICWFAHRSVQDRILELINWQLCEKEQEWQRREVFCRTPLFSLEQS